MSLAGEIRELYAERGSLTINEIAEIIGCRPEYVRVCARQRVNGRSAIDDRHYEKFKRDHGYSPDGYRYVTDPEFRARKLTNYNRWRRKRIANDPTYRERINSYKRAWAARKREFLATA